jgi:hypothetical protein
MKFFKEIKNPVTEAPHYPEDPDEWEAMFGARKKKAERDPEDYEPRTTPAQQAADDEEALSQKLQAQHKAFAQKRKVEYVDQEGSAPNGQKYNKLYVINAKDMQTANHEEYLFDKHEWGAKKVVDTKKEQNEDGSVTATLYIVDNHKYGMWKPWKNMPAKEGVSDDALEESEEDSPVLGAIIHRIMVGRTDLLAKYGPQRIMTAAQDVADFVGDVDEIGTSDVSAWVKQVEQSLAGANESVTEADNPEDVIRVDVPLFIRLMEYAREDAQTDMDLHNVTERLTKLSATGETVTMDSYDAIVGAKTIEEADMATGNKGYDNMLAVMKAVDAGQDATFDLAGEPITLEYPEARFLAGKYKAFLKAGRQEEFLKYMDNPVAFDRLMLQLRQLIDKQKNFRGSVPGERGVEEAAPTVAKFAGGIGLGMIAAAGAPAIVGILGPLLGIPFAAYGAYSAAKLGMSGVEKLWDMAAEKLGGSDKVEQYTTAQIAKLPPEKAQAAQAVVKQVAESRKSTAAKLSESTGPMKIISRRGEDMDESAPPNFPMDLEKKLLAQYKDDPSRAYATMWTIHNKQKPKKESIAALPAVNENEYWCAIDKQAKPIPEGYKKLQSGYLTRK